MRAATSKQMMKDIVQRFVSDLQGVVRKHVQNEVTEKISALTKSKNGKQPRFVKRPAKGFIRVAGRRSSDNLARVQGAILKLLEAKPGLRSEEMQKELKLSADALSLPMRQLIEQGELKRKGVARGSKYWIK